MSDNYTKLFSSITESSVWGEAYSTRLVWIAFLAKCNKHGEVHAAIPGVARMANVTLDEADSALKSLMAPDKWSRTPDNEGRRVEPIDGGWRILNHAKFDAIRGSEERKAYKAKWDRENRPDRPNSSNRPPTTPDNPDNKPTVPTPPVSSQQSGIENKRRGRRLAAPAYPLIGLHQMNGSHGQSLSARISTCRWKQPSSLTTGTQQQGRKAEKPIGMPRGGTGFATRTHRISAAFRPKPQRQSLKSTKCSGE